jgi:glycosyltransferase involved in cell wall biosynthesis
MSFDKIHVKTVLIFEHSLSGHRFEYICHIFNKAVLQPTVNFIFALPKLPLELRSVINFEGYQNIELIVIGDTPKSAGLFLSSLRMTKSIRNIVKKHKVTDVFLPSFTSFLPFIGIMLNNVSISGIIYTMYLYEWKEKTWIIKMKNVLIYTILARRKIFKNIYLLNDTISVRYINKIYRTNKFSFLPDPFHNMSDDNLSSIRGELDINDDVQVFLHFGALSERKGTLEILKGIKLMDERSLENKCFIFAGKVVESIKTEFYSLLSEVTERTQILCFDKFCDYSFISALCVSSDYLLMPYKVTTQSSGVIGYAAKYNIPVIAPRENLIGRLVRQYELGYTITLPDAYYIANFLNDIGSIKHKDISKTYLKANSIESFKDVIMTNILK